MDKSDWSKHEEEVLKFWQEQQIFAKSLAQTADGKEFIFYDGPPTANGRPGVHHLEARVFKDLIPRYKTMRGYHVRRKPGWDTHGLPVELEVEKQLGLKSKKEIEAFGIAEFNKKCRESVWKYLVDWQRFTERIGYWLEDKPYITYTPEYIESVWQVIKKVAERNLLYQDYKVVPWCPRCGTALSSHELAQGYQTVKDLSVTVKFKIKDPVTAGLPENTFLLAWTTTPWTLPGNVVLAVGTDIEYVIVQAGDKKYILAADRLEALFKDKEYQVVEKKLGKELMGLKYEPLYAFSPTNAQSHQVYAADFVTTTDGTGIVHTAVMYGQDDFELGTKFNLPKHHLVAENGTFLPEVTPWAGKFVKDEEVAVGIIKDLAGRGLLFKKEKFEHTYPFCWRCKTAIIYYARNSWYIRMSQLREELMRENEKIHWEPQHIRDGRFGEWLREVKDWAISRERYWGTPLPVWQSVESKKKYVIGSVEELKARAKKSGNTYWMMRHGEAESNARGIINSNDTQPASLTATGQEQVRVAAAQLVKEKIDYIVCSPLLRTRQTAELVQQILKLPAECLVVEPRLREIDLGELHGQPIAAYRDAFPTYSERFATAPKGGESLTDVRQRVGEVLYELEQKYQGKKILIVTHEYVAWMLEAVRGGLNQEQSIALRGANDDFISVAAVRALDFVSLPHNDNYELDLHRPYIDEVTLLGDDGEELKRLPEVMDVWLDSGAMPFAQDHYPFSTAEPLYPADFISEAIDQTRGWFYTLHAVGVLMGRGAAYKNVICLGHVLDKEGKKMSKSVGNVVDPWQMIEKFGVDPLRFWMLSVNQPGEAKNFDEESVAEVVRKVFNPLLNVLNFYGLYSGEMRAGEVEQVSTHALDKWIMARLHETTAAVTTGLDGFLIMEPARALRDFILDLSQWYLRRSRERFKSESEAERQAAVHTTRLVLQQVAILLAPFTPFLAEFVYQKVKQGRDPGSVHLTTWPTANKVDEKLLADMQTVRELVTLALESRTKAGLKVRQPLAKLTIKTELAKELREIIKDEVNVKEVAVDTDLADLIDLDITLTDELRKEGEVRELIRQIQDWRKETGLQPSQPVAVAITAPEASKKILEQYRAEITQATSLTKLTVTVGEKFAVSLLT